MENGLVDSKYQMFEHNAYNLLKSENPFTTIRNPIDCIPSAIIKYESKHEDRIERFVEWYLDFYSQCLNKNCTIILFEKLIDSPKKIFNNLANILNIKNHKFNEINYLLGEKNKTPICYNKEIFLLKKEIYKSNSVLDAIKLFNNLKLKSI